MSIEFAKAYKNFDKFHEERVSSNSATNSSDKSKMAGGLLAPRTPRQNPDKPAQTELDKVSMYVDQIRQRRMKIKNGK